LGRFAAKHGGRRNGGRVVDVRSRMILLHAIRLDVYGRFQYRLELAGEPSFLTSDPKEADMLSDLGVNDGTRLIEHAREWGSLELTT
jgi:hypothetical protein